MNEQFLNEMTVLNNELVNTQRILVKQNLEITRLNQELKLNNEDLVQFTYVVSHDLKEPLRMVTSFMGLLKSKYGDLLDEKGKVYINFAIEGGQRMQKMIDELLSLSRIGRENSVKELADISIIVEEVKENILKLSEDAGAKIFIQTALPVLPVHRSDIMRLFQNLLSNAIKFREKDQNPIIYLAAKEQDGDWLFSIQDNGIGIDKEKYKQIFEVFTRLNLREIYEGSGIGLAVCKKVVQHHGGKIWIESEDGKGSTFYFTLSKE